MVIDTSAIVAILLGEPEAEAISRAIAEGSPRLISVFSILETSIVIEVKKGEQGVRELDLLLHRAQIETVGMDVEQGRWAKTAWQRFGRGRHRAGLNIGDCCAYALAATTGEPLLCKGDDFTWTDLELTRW